MVKVKRLLGIVVILALLIGGSAPFWVSIGHVAAQDSKEFQLAPINPKALEPASPYGYRPSTMDLSHLEGISAQEAMTLLAQQPSSWDWRDYGKVTPVKAQNSCGTCWTFGTTSVLESAVLLGESAEYDFSEQSVTLCVDRSWVYLYDDPTDPCQAGGNSLKASEVFIKKGAVLEMCNPYDTDGLQCNGTCTCDSCPPVKKVTGYRCVTGDQSQIALIKNAVYQRPVTMSFYYHPSGEYTDPTYGAIYDYYPCGEDANHLVSIIGWDDFVPHSNPDHAGTGAWLVKNSWGIADSWAGGAGISDGYFWLAYNSSSMTEIAYLEYGDYNANEALYYWDEAGIMNAVGAGTTSCWMASVFTSEQYGKLTHVDFWTTSSNASYEIYVYDDSFGSQLAYQTGSCAELGYYSIPLTTPVPMSNGQQFTVAVKMTTPGFDYPIPVEYEEAGYCEPPIQTGACFLGTDGSNWVDAEPYGWNVSLRAKITTEPASYDIPLFAGWNLIGLPLIPESQSIEDILAGIDVDGVAAYDGATQEWYLYSPGAPSDLTEMTCGKGYWAKVTSPCTLTIEGTAPQLPYDIPLFAGWNLIGLPLIPESQSIEDILAGIDVDGVAAYDGATKEWYLYSPGAPSDLTEMTSGKGYWVQVTEPCTLTIEGG